MYDTEYTPNWSSLEKLSYRAAADISTDIANLDWESDPNLALSLIRETAALLIAHNTETHTGTDFAAMQDTLKTLIYPYSESSMLTVTTPWINKRNAFLIHSPGMMQTAEAIKNSVEYSYGSTAGYRIPVNCPIIHIHLDTVPANGLASYESYVDKKTGLIYGRGIIDMKGQAALIPFFLKNFKQANIDNFMFIVSTDEECHGKYGGAKLMSGIDSNLIIDLEPIPLVNGVYADQIISSVSLHATYSPNGKDLHTLQQEISEKIGQTGTLPYMFGDQLLLNLNNLSLYNLPTALNEIAKILGLSREKIRRFKSSKNTSYLKAAERAVIKSALTRHSTYRESERNMHALSGVITVDQGDVQRHRRVAILSKYSTLPTVTGHNNVIVGPADQVGRHSPYEAGTSHDLFELLNATTAIVQGFIALDN